MHLIRFLSHADWLSRRRVIAYGVIYLLAEIVVLVLPTLQHWWETGAIQSLGPTDFLAFYASGYIADTTAAPQIYDISTSLKTQAMLLGEQQSQPWEFFFLYPPVFILICTAFPLVSYTAAYFAWNTATLTFLASTLRAMTRGWGITLALLSFPAIFLTISIGQNALLTAALFGAGACLLETSPIAAGCLLGAICYKPNYFLVVPVALLAGRQWRALAALCLTVGGLIAATIVAFGWATWEAYFGFSHFVMQHSFEGSWGFWVYASWFASVRLAGGPPWLATLAQGLGIAGAEIITAIIWYRSSNPAVRAATLAAATIVAAPVMVSYDLTLAVVATAWIIRDARRTGYLPWEKAFLGLSWVVAQLDGNFQQIIRFPLMPIIGIGLLVFSALRSARPEPHPPCPAR